MNFHNNGGYGCQPYPAPTSGYMPMQPSHTGYPPEAQPFQGYPGYPPVQQPQYPLVQQPFQDQRYPSTAASPYPLGGSTYPGFSNNVPSMPEPFGASYPAPAAASALPYPMQPSSNVLSMPEPFGASYPASTAASALPYPMQPPSSGYGASQQYSVPYSAPSYPATPAYSTPQTYPPTPTYPGGTTLPAYSVTPTYPGAPAPPAYSATPTYPGAQTIPALSTQGSLYPSVNGYQPGIASGSHTFASSHPQGQGTVRPSPSFNSEHDAKVLRKAMKGLGTDEKTIINVLGSRTNQQRQQIKLIYKTMFGRDLVSDLSSELSFRFKQTILALMMTPVEYDASELYKAIKGFGTNEEALVEILCTRSNSEIASIKAMYKNLYRHDLEKDLIGDTSGYFRRFLVSLVTANRREDGYVDMERARREAMELYQAGEARWGTDESKFNQVLCSQSHAQLRATFDEYQRIAHRSILQSLSSEMSGDLYLGMKTLANVVINPHRYFADRLYRAMKGAGTNDDTLIRVVVSRSEIDLVQIKQEFQRNYGQSLEAFIQDDTSGDYCKILLAVVRGY